MFAWNRNKSVHLKYVQGDDDDDADNDVDEHGDVF